MPNSKITQVDLSRWQEAQAFELKFAQDFANQGDDYNYWWKKAFADYAVLRGLCLPNVLEVGCGPHTNARLILPLIQFEKLWLEDPLINAYMDMKSIRRFFRFIKLRSPVAVSTLHQEHNAVLLPEPLETLSLPDKSINLCICINVLDHVQDADLCFANMHRVLTDGGIFVLAQDLSSDEDMQLCPESWADIGHPIKMDDKYLDAQVSGLSVLYKKILPRNHGRNPRCHYGTYLFIGKNSSTHESA